MGIGLAVLIVAAIIASVVIQTGSRAVEREAALQSTLLDLSAWRSGQPGLEDVEIRRVDADVPFLVVEGAAASDEDFERLMDRISAYDAVEFRVEMTVSGDTIASRDVAAPIAIGSTDAHAIGRILISGQPGANDFAALPDMGVTVVMNNRKEGEWAADERSIVEGLGMRYVHLPFRGAQELTDDVIDEALDVFGQTEGSVFAHCASGNRTSALWLAHRVVNEGVGFDAALEEARGIGLRTQAYEDVVRAYVERR